MIFHAVAALTLMRPLLPAAIMLMVAAGTPLRAHANQLDLLQVAKKYIQCSQPLLTEHAPHTRQGRGGFGAVVQGEPYYFSMLDRVLIAFDAAGRREPAAHLKMDRPLPTEFDEHAAWRVRMLQEVADLTDSAVERSTPRPRMEILTLNKSSLGGKFAGQSLLIDPDRDVIVEWDWDIAARYRGVQDVMDLQASIWKRLIPCLD